MNLSPVIRVSAAGPPQPPAPPAPAPGGIGPPSASGQPQPVLPVAPAASAPRDREAGLSDRPTEAPSPDEREAEAPPEAAPEPLSDAHGPVLALMRQAAALCRIANSRQPDEGGTGAASPGMAQSTGDLSVRGNLVVADEQGVRVGSGQIYRSGELVAAFSGTNLAFIGGGLVSTRL